MAFLTELATNATKHNIPIVIYSGNDDALVAHRGSEGLCEEIQKLILSDVAFWATVVIQVCFSHNTVAPFNSV
jgi:hypothetical protein